MITAICSVDGCTRAVKARTLCKKHYIRWWVHVGRELTPTDGMSKTPTYQSWASMIQRCTNPKSNGWKNYGGANPPVVVCDRWRCSFESFLEDMGPRPEGTSLGRFGDVGSYEPGNVSWQTRAEQGVEQRRKCARAFPGTSEAFSNAAAGWSSFGLMLDELFAPPLAPHTGEHRDFSVRDDW